MAIFTDKKSGKKSFHMNPQMGKSLHGGIKGKESPQEENLEEKISPGIHKKVAEYNGHEHNGRKLAHHVEIHHGGHPHGEPPAHEGHSHHVIHHPHGGGEPEIRNHEHYDNASEDAKDSMHAECPECGHDLSQEADDEATQEGTEA